MYTERSPVSHFGPQYMGSDQAITVKTRESEPAFFQVSVKRFISTNLGLIWVLK